MVTQLSQEPLITVRDLLRANWDPSNTNQITPDISTGWWDDGSDQTQVSVIDPDDSPIGGGDTGVTGIKSGGGVVQDRGGFMRVHHFAHRRLSALDTDNDGEAEINPKTLVWNFLRESRRIILNNVLTSGDPDLDSIMPGADTRNVLDDQPPPVYDRILNVTYTWRAMS